jgi:hypothetical protein
MQKAFFIFKELIKMIDSQINNDEPMDNSQVYEKIVQLVAVFVCLLKELVLSDQ